EGHLLIVTTGHAMCMGATRRELWPVLLRARARVARLFRRAYGSGLLIFEHGPAAPQAAGSCIDHAHWHCLPSTVDIRPVVERHGLEGGPATLADLHALHRDGRSYLYVEDDGIGWAYLADELPGQFLREAATTAIAGAELPTEAWRWQQSMT